LRASANETEDRTDQSDPSSAKVDEQSNQCAQVKRDVEGQTGIRPPRGPREKNQMSCTGDRKKFGEALNRPENNRLQYSHWLCQAGRVGERARPKGFVRSPLVEPDVKISLIRLLCKQSTRTARRRQIAQA